MFGWIFKQQSLKCLLNICCTILAIIFLLHEFYNFLFLQPTTSSTKEIHLSANIFPVVSLCPEPAFNLNNLNHHGYKGVFKYYTGNLPNPDKPRGPATETYSGWGGKGRMNQTELLKNLSTGLRVSDMVRKARFLYKDPEMNYNYGEAIRSEAAVVYPIGQCLHLSIPRNIEKEAIMKLSIKFNNTFMTNIKDVGVYLKNPNNDVGFLPSPYKINGDRFVPKAEVAYFIKGFVTEHMEDITNCKVYKKMDEFGTCKVDEIREKLTILIGCVPFWFTDMPGICGPLNISQSLAGSVYDMLFDIYAQNFPSRCKDPCTSVHYEAKHESTSPRETSSIFFIFHQKAILSSSQLVVDGFTLVNRVGGIIGFCRNVFWVLVLLTGVTNIFHRFWDYISVVKMQMRQSQNKSAL